MTYRDYLLKVEGFIKKQEQEWAIARWQVWHGYLLSPYIKPLRKPKTPVALLSLPSDTKNRPVDLRTNEERKEVREFFQSKGLKIIN